jgi:hypothetical protein
MVCVIGNKRPVNNTFIFTFIQEVLEIAYMFVYTVLCEKDITR